MNALLVGLMVAAAPEFTFDEATASCRNAAGDAGWNVGATGPCADYAGQNLEGRSFAEQDLRGARFDAAQLKGATFFRADLRGARFEGADLTGAELRHARLTDAVLTSAKLRSAKLQNADLSRAKLTGADLINACVWAVRFEGADLRGAKFSKCVAQLEGARWAGAIVDAATLPYAAERLAMLGVTVQAPVVQGPVTVAGTTGT